MGILHEVQFTDFDPQAGVLAGEALPEALAPTAEAIGIAAVAPQVMAFADREPKPSEVARDQLNREAAAAEVARRKALQENAAARRDAEADTEE